MKKMDEIGMNWWNSLTETNRNFWLISANTATPAIAWKYFLSMNSVPAGWITEEQKSFVLRGIQWWDALTEEQKSFVLAEAKTDSQLVAWELFSELSKDKTLVSTLKKLTGNV